MAQRDGGSDLLARLARAVGLSGLAALTMASGPCGACQEPEQQCQSLEELSRQRAQALGGLAGAAGAAGSGTGLAGAAGQPAPANPITDFNKQRIAAWNPALGCPTPEQFNALSDEVFGSTSGGARRQLPADDGQCCYRIEFTCGEGRPFLVDGSQRVAELRDQPRPPLDPFDAALVESWLTDALLEHASIAAFARLSLQLLHHGAPSDLVRDAQRASLDELRHAEFCFSRASNAARATLSPGRLSVTNALSDLSFEAVIRANLIEGCVGETLAAVRVHEQARRAADPALRAALLAIGEDETRHAELAWRILKWCSLVAPEATRSIARDVVEQHRAVSLDAVNEPFDDDPRWAVEGRLSRAERRRLDASTWRHVLTPLFGWLLDAPRDCVAEHVPEPLI